MKKLPKWRNTTLSFSERFLFQSLCLWAYSIFHRLPSKLVANYVIIFGSSIYCWNKCFSSALCSNSLGCRVARALWELHRNRTSHCPGFCSCAPAQSPLPTVVLVSKVRAGGEMYTHDRRSCASALFLGHPALFLSVWEATSIFYVKAEAAKFSSLCKWDYCSKDSNNLLLWTEPEFCMQSFPVVTIWCYSY